MIRKFQDAFKKLAKQCYGGSAHDKNYTIIAPPVKRRKTHSNSSENRQKSTTRFVLTFFLFAICALTIVLILYVGEFILKSEPLIIARYSSDMTEIDGADLKRTTEVVSYDEQPTSDEDVIVKMHMELETTNYSSNLSPESATEATRHNATTFVSGKEEFQLPEAPSATEVPSSACQLPNLSPFDASILEYVELPLPRLDCSRKYRRPIIFTTDFGSNLIQVEDPYVYYLDDCCYNPFERLNEEDIKISDTCYPIEEKITPIPPEHEFIVVMCYQSDKGNSTRRRVIDMFSFVHEDSDRLTLTQYVAKYSKLKPKEALNVVMVGIDAVSHMNFIRTMPRSHNYLQNISAIGMNGYTKVGDNTFPNVAPILTGLDVSELEAEGSCWADGGYFDECPFVWKNYSRAGYVTSYAEDEQFMAAFNYGKYGFEVQPTDYYLRPFMMTLADSLSHVSTGNAHLCYGPRLGFAVLLEYVQKLAVTMARPNVDRNYFSFMWSNSLSHDDLNTPSYGDKDLVDFLRWFEEPDGDMNVENTILILLSDHGIRWGDIRTTFQGRIEERMPFLYFVFPGWFQAKYGTAIRNLKANADRLTTPFDLHETLLDLVDPAKYISNEALATHRHANLAAIPRGISLFAPIPTSRTCVDAAIENHWCVCHSMQVISDPSQDERVLNATDAIMSNLNEILSPYPQCAQLQLTEILNAQQLVQPLVPNLDEESTPSPSANEGQEHEAEEEVPSSKLTITFKTSPSDAIFEASVIQEGASGEWAISGDVSRVNLYGDQSRCVDEYKMKKYCFCP